MPNYYSRPSWRSASYTNAQQTRLTPKIMQAKFAGRCADCGGALAVGDTIRYHNGKAMHVTSLACDEANAQRAALAATLCSNGGEANRFAASAGSAFRGPSGTSCWYCGTAVVSGSCPVCADATLTRADWPAVPPAIDLTPIRTFIQGAKDRGLKYPKLRVLDVDGQTELALGLTVAGHNPGSVSVKRNGEYLGLIRPDGTTKGAITPALAQHLLTIAAAPAAAAKAYAVLMCRCSFCSLALTDEASVELGYGPVCAKHWGLPHKAKGTKAPVAVETTEAA